MSTNTAPKELTAANKRLRDRSPLEWVSELMALPFPLRDGVAKIVWWDWMSGTTVSDRTDLFDQFLKFSTLDFTDDELIAGLLAVGYTELQATSRLRRGL